MFSGIASLSLSSALWLTAMAANPLGLEIARRFGVNMAFALVLTGAGKAFDGQRLIRPGEEYRDQSQGHINLLGVSEVIPPVMAGDRAEQDGCVGNIFGEGSDLIEGGRVRG